ncbi:MAG: response regulator [Raineya sp.]|jgi:CheY-like chemotaxis protein|nr:response regulator [Raineya sp.]
MQDDPLPYQFYVAVDDDAINNLVCKKVIEKINPNAEVLCFTSPSKAIEYLFENSDKKPNLIILDINMPEIDGWEFLNRYQKIENPASVVMLSSSKDESDIKKSRTYDIVKGYIEKPLNIDKITKYI